MTHRPLNSITQTRTPRLTATLAVAASLAAGATLSACGEREEAYDSPVMAAAPAPMMMAERSYQADEYAGDRASASSPVPIDGDGAPAPEGVAPLLAYSHSAAIEAPARAVAGLMGAHRDACMAAGSALCQVVNASVSESGEDYVYADLSIRAAPAWLDPFRASLATDAGEVGGRVTSTAMNVEDLTRAIVDAEARLGARRALRDRLQGLLETANASVEELVNVERELANVQSDIEGAEASIRVMRGRVSMSNLSISYRPKANPVSEGVFQPISDAINGAVGTFAGALGGIISLIAFLAPWALLLTPFVWLLARWRKRRALARTAAKPTPPRAG